MLIFPRTSTVGYKVDPSLTKPITKFLGDPPKDIAGASRYLGLVGYFCRHIEIKSVNNKKTVVNTSLTAWGRETPSSTNEVDIYCQKIIMFNLSRLQLRVHTLG